MSEELSSKKEVYLRELMASIVERPWLRIRQNGFARHDREETGGCKGGRVEIDGLSSKG
jgi:hypothetical protein